MRKNVTKALRNQVLKIENNRNKRNEEKKEAVMEALPQAVLQVGFAARAGRVSLLNGLSIALSLVVLSSKG